MNSMIRTIFNTGCLILIPTTLFAAPQTPTSQSTAQGTPQTISSETQLEPFCRAKAKKIALNTYSSCLTEENQNVALEVLKQKYQDEIAEMKQKFEEQIKALHKSLEASNNKNTPPIPLVKVQPPQTINPVNNNQGNKKLNDKILPTKRGSQQIKQMKQAKQIKSLNEFNENETAVVTPNIPPEPEPLIESTYGGEFQIRPNEEQKYDSNN